MSQRAAARPPSFLPSPLRLLGGEDGEPLDEGGGDEVGGVWLHCLVAAAHGGEDGGSTASGKEAFPSGTWERGVKAALRDQCEHRAFQPTAK